MNGIEETIGFELTAFDWAIVVLIGLSTLMSLRRGFMKEALSLGTWIAAFVIARQFHSAMDQLLVAQIADMPHALDTRFRQAVPVSAGFDKLFDLVFAHTPDLRLQIRAWQPN